MPLSWIPLSRRANRKRTPLEQGFAPLRNVVAAMLRALAGAALRGGRAAAAAPSAAAAQLQQKRFLNIHEYQVRRLVSPMSPGSPPSPRPGGDSLLTAADATTPRRTKQNTPHRAPRS